MSGVAPGAVGIGGAANGAEVCKILEHIGADPQAPRITPARGAPLHRYPDGRDFGGNQYALRNS